jgi:hypothetical protein
MSTNVCRFSYLGEIFSEHLSVVCFWEQTFVDMAFRVDATDFDDLYLVGKFVMSSCQLLKWIFKKYWSWREKDALANHLINQHTKIKDRRHSHKTFSPELFFQTSYRSLKMVGAIKSYSKKSLGFLTGTPCICVKMPGMRPLRVSISKESRSRTIIFFHVVEFFSGILNMQSICWRYFSFLLKNKKIKYFYIF